jgi:hypothetical protein
MIILSSYRWLASWLYLWWLRGRGKRPVSAAEYEAMLQDDRPALHSATVKSGHKKCQKIHIFWHFGRSSGEWQNENCRPG